jgi:hypothetical protein
VVWVRWSGSHCGNADQGHGYVVPRSPRKPPRITRRLRDSDDVAVARSRLLLDGNPDATVIQGDLREPVRLTVRAQADEPYEVIHLGGEAAAILPLAELRRLFRTQPN